MARDSPVTLSRFNARMLLLTSTLRVAFGMLILVVGVVLFAAICVPLLPWRVARIKVCNVFGHSIGRAIIAVTGTTVLGHGQAEMAASFPAIYVSNHTSPLDIFLGIWLSPIGVCGVAKKEVVYYPFFGQLYYISGHLMIDRSNHGRAVEALRGTAELMKRANLGLWIWPEGTRARDGRLLPFKKGIVHLALATGLPIVPVVVKGAHRVWRKSSLIVQPGAVAVKVMPPISTKGWTLENIEAHVEEVRSVFVRELPDDQKPLDMLVTKPAAVAVNG